MIDAADDKQEILFKYYETMRAFTYNLDAFHQQLKEEIDEENDHYENLAKV